MSSIAPPPSFGYSLYLPFDVSFHLFYVLLFLFRPL
jgi:hypothetical protein